MQRIKHKIRITDNLFLQEYLKRGCPHSLRGSVWAQVYTEIGLGKVPLTNGSFSKLTKKFVKTCYFLFANQQGIPFIKKKNED